MVTFFPGYMKIFVCWFRILCVCVCVYREHPSHINFKNHNVHVTNKMHFNVYGVF